MTAAVTSCASVKRETADAMPNACGGAAQSGVRCKKRGDRGILRSRRLLQCCCGCAGVDCGCEGTGLPAQRRLGFVGGGGGTGARQSGGVGVPGRAGQVLVARFGDDADPDAFRLRRGGGQQSRRADAALLPARAENRGALAHRGWAWRCSNCAGWRWRSGTKTGPAGGARRACGGGWRRLAIEGRSGQTRGKVARQRGKWPGERKSGPAICADGEVA